MNIFHHSDKILQKNKKNFFMLIKNPLLKINMITIGMFIMMVIFKVMI